MKRFMMILVAVAAASLFSMSAGTAEAGGGCSYGGYGGYGGGYGHGGYYAPRRAAYYRPHYGHGYHHDYQSHYRPYYGGRHYHGGPRVSFGFAF